MRRSKKLNVYTSHTLKFCPDCIQVCEVCKGACKDSIINGVDPSTVAPHHKERYTNKIKSHKVGVGSLRKGRIFLCCTFGRHRCFSREMKNFETRGNKHRRIANDLQEQLMIYSLVSS